jgi:hypothetical protein
MEATYIQDSDTYIIEGKIVPAKTLTISEINALKVTKGADKLVEIPKLNGEII